MASKKLETITDYESWYPDINLLRTAFESKDLFLSENASLSSSEDGDWEITDGTVSYYIYTYNREQFYDPDLGHVVNSLDFDIYIDHVTITVFDYTTFVIDVEDCLLRTIEVDLTVGFQPDSCTTNAIGAEPGDEVYYCVTIHNPTESIVPQDWHILNIPELGITNARIETDLPPGESLTLTSADFPDSELGPRTVSGNLTAVASVTSYNRTLNYGVDVTKPADTTQPSDPPFSSNTATANARVITDAIPLPAMDDYGRIQNGDQTHVDAAYFSFDGQPGDVTISFDAWDVDFADEIEILLNGERVGYAPSESAAVQAAGIDEVEDNEAWTSHALVLPDALVNNSGSNLLTFDNTYNPPEIFWWGVRRVTVGVPIPLPAMGEYGKIAGGDQTHPNHASFLFNGQPGEMRIAFDAWDMDTDTEVQIKLNGQPIGFVPTGNGPVQVADVDANDRWTNHTVTLPDNLVDDTGVNLLTFDNTTNPPKTYLWGVRRVTVGVPIVLPALGEYGYIAGSDQSHPNEVSFSFAGAPGSMVIRFSAWDVDTATEIQVRVNGQSVGFVPTRAGLVEAASVEWNSRWRNHALVLPDNLVNDSGLNVVTFDNTTNPPKTYTWGLRDVTVNVPIALPAPGEYGYIAGSDQSHPDEVNFLLDGQPGHMLIAFDAWDVDTATEVQLRVNGKSVGYAPTVTGPVEAAGVAQNNRWTRHTVLLPDDLVNDSGPNVVTFDNTTNPPKTYAWGVRDVWATAVIALPAPGEYGYIAGSDQTHPNEVNFLFDGEPGHMLIAFSAWDVDTATEIQVRVNGESVGYVPTSTGPVEAAGVERNTHWSSHVLVLPDNLVNDSGVNVVTFDNTTNPPKTYAWGVRDVSASVPIALPAPGEYGYIAGSDQTHPNEVSFLFDGEPGHMLIRFDAWDVDTATEVKVRVNGEPVGYAPTVAGPVEAAGVEQNNRWTRHTLVLPDNLVSDSGLNVVTFDNTSNPPKTYAWGVRDVSASELIALPAFDEYGYIPGSDQTHPNEVNFLLDGQPGPMLIRFNAWDVDNETEIQVRVNGESVGYAPTAHGLVEAAGVQQNNGWTAHFVVLPDNLVMDGSPNVVTFDNTSNPPKTYTWGVHYVYPSALIALPAPGEYGYIDGSDQTHPNSVQFLFDGEPGSMSIAFEAWDVDNDTEIGVALNGQFFNYVPYDDFACPDCQSAADVDSPDANNGWTSHTLLLPEHRVNNDGANWIWFYNRSQDSSSDGSWGVADVKIENPATNDDISNATSVSPTPFTDIVDTTFATVANDDPVFPCGSNTPGLDTVWYEFTANGTTDFEANTFGSSYDTMLALWTGSRGNLVNVACNDDTGGRQSQIDIAIPSGSYYLEVAEYEYATRSADQGKAVMTDVAGINGGNLNLYVDMGNAVAVADTGDDLEAAPQIFLPIVTTQ